MPTDSIYELVKRFFADHQEEYFEWLEKKRVVDNSTVPTGK